MKLLMFSLLLVTTGVIADEPAQDVVVMSPAEHRFLVKQFMDMDAKIKVLERKLQEEKERTGCT